MNDIYRKAYARYLRRGTPLDVSLKAAEHPTPYYIWRTRGDDKVRISHAENNGKIFAWDNPPPTGNPGEDYGCRCWAEPYYDLVERTLNGASDALVSVLNYFKSILAQAGKWDNRHFVAHYYIGSGRTVTLEETGSFEDIRSYYREHYLSRFIDQIRLKAIWSSDGVLNDNFENSYSFGEVLYSHGGSTISGVFVGRVETLAFGKKAVFGKAQIKFNDEFTDPFRIIDRVLPFVGIYYPPEWVKLLADLGGAKYPIIGEWEEDIVFSF
ncbi:MAG: phage minor head protein [Rickettsiales bacterium]